MTLSSSEEEFVSVCHVLEEVVYLRALLKGFGVHFLRDLARDGHMKLVKCAGTQNVSDALTKSLSRPGVRET